MSFGDSQASSQVSDSEALVDDDTCAEEHSCALSAMQRQASYRSSASEASQDKIPVIVDTDIGSFSDDFWALAFVLTNPALDVKFIITSGRNTVGKAKIAGKYLQNMGRSIPIGAGHSDETECPWMGRSPNTGLLECVAAGTPKASSVPLLGRWAAKFRNSQLGGINEAVRVLKESTGRSPLYLLIGGAQNVARILDVDANIFRRTQTRIVAMGGTLTGHGSWNAQLDPTSWRRMMKAGNVTLVTTEFTSTIRLKDRLYDIFIDGSSRIALALSNVVLSLANYGAHTEVCDQSSDLIFDAAAALVGMGKFTSLYETKLMSVDMNESGRLTLTSNGIEVRVVTGWIGQGLADFESILAHSIATGVIA